VRASALFLIAILPSCLVTEPSPVSGTFVPEFEDARRARPPLAITLAEGFYERMGDDVHVSMSVEWQNSDPILSDFPVRLRVPLPPADLLDVDGTVAMDTTAALFVRSDDREPIDVMGSLQVAFDQVSRAAVVRAVDLAPGDVPIVLAYGTARQRVMLSFSYRTVGQ
jgi:hypothetical protein